jgi:hypothetical protein
MRLYLLYKLDYTECIFSLICKVYHVGVSIYSFTGDLFILLW